MFETEKINAFFSAWPIKNASSLINTAAVDLFLIIYIMHYHVVPYNVFALLHFSRLKYLLVLNAPVIWVSTKLRSFYLMPEDICFLSFLPIGNIFRLHVTYLVPGDNSFTSSLFKEWILINYT